MANDRQDRIEQYAAAYGALTAALRRFPREMWHYRSRVEQWTIHEIVVHIADSEANSFVRLRRLIAEPGQVVMAYDENAWARLLDYPSQSPDDALELSAGCGTTATCWSKACPSAPGRTPSSILKMA
jgi:hypothetical protein